MKNLAHIASAIAEAVSVPRLREQRRPPSPPDRLPPRPPGRPSYKTASAAGGRGLVGFARGLGAAACLALFGAFALPSTAGAQTPPVCDRTEQVRDEIVYQAGVSTCDEVTDAHLAAITSLYLASVGITLLKEGDFSGLTALQELALDGNQLSSLPARVFSGLTSLETLYLHYNQLGLLPARVFSGLTSLETLYLHYNQLGLLPARVFSGLTSLETLYLHYNQLSLLPAGVFSGLTSLQELALDGNAVDPLPVAVSLEQAGRGGFKAVAPTAAPFALTLPVSVVNGEIDGETTLTIPAGMVSSASVSVTRSAGSTSAVTADIGTLPERPSGHQGYALEKSSGLPLEVIAAESGAPTPVCDRTERVRDGIVAEVPGVSTCGGVSDAHLAAITSLDFNFAEITSLQEGDFSGLTSLQELYLNGNQLSLLPAGVFSGLTALERLDLQENQLSSLLAGVFSGLTALRELDLDRNQLSLLPASVFSRLTAVTSIDLSGNALSSLPAGVFSGLTSLETLYLNENQLSLLPAGVFSGLTSLETLYLDGNPDDPLPVAVSLEQAGRGGFKAVAPTAAPFALTLPVSVVNGEIDGETTLTIPAGMVQSASVSVTRSAGSTSAVTADIGTLPELPSNHFGYALEKSSGLPLEVIAAESGAPTPVCDRTERVRDEIVYQAEVSTCGGVSDTHLAAVTFLDLEFASITLLKEGDFSGLTSLQELHLAGNEFSSLPAGVFSGLTSLERLDLQENQLSLLPAGVFSGLTSLRELDLESNQLSLLPAGVFSGLTSLQELNLAGNALSSLDAGVFSGLTSLQDLYLGDNELSLLPTGVFSGLTSLRELHLYVNELSLLPAGVFSGLTSLETLYLDGNPVDPLPVAVSLELAGRGGFKAVAPTAAPFALTLPISVVNGEIDGGATTLTIPAGMVQSDLVSVTRSAGLTSAVTADIGTLPELPSNHLGYALEKSSGLPLEVIAAESGAPETVCDRTEQVRDEIVYQAGVSTCGGVSDADLAAITFLGLSFAEITSLKEGDFSGLTALEELNLNDNALSSLDAGVLSGLTSLTTLNLNDNALSSLDAGVLSGLTSLTTLNLNGNALSSLDAGAFSGLTALEVLQLESNELSLLPTGVFSGLTSLRELYLYVNELSLLPAGVFSGLTSLATLELDGNPVDPLPVAVSLELAGRGGFKAVAPTAAPFALTLPISVVNGEIDGGATTLTIPAGMVSSDAVSVTRSAGSASAVTADIGTLPGLPSNHQGYALEKSSGLPLEVFAAESGAPTPVCDRTEQVRDGIVAEVPGVSTCGGVTDADLAAITFLGLNSVGITLLQEGDFSGLTALEELDLGDNALSSLDAGVLSGLTSLTTLNLNDNALSSLDAGVLSGLTSLTTLNLNGNALNSLDAGAFSGLTALEVLQLESNDLSSLLAGVLSGLTSLQELYLYANDLSSLPDGAFSGLTALETLELDGNAVDPLPVAVSLEPAGPGGFKAVAPTAAPFALMLPVSVVNGVIVGGATTLTIPAGMVQSDLVSVTRSAGSTSAVTADIGTLPGLPSNHQGYALEKSSGLPLEVIAAESGAPTPVCDRTEQVRDEIVAVSGVSTCGGVTDADLAGITDLYFQSADITSLKEGDFSGLTALEELDLGDNALSSLDAGVLSGLTSLTTLNLGDNALSSLDAGVLSGLTSLTTLNLNDNALSSLDAGVLSGLTSLTTLNLSDNALSSLDAGVLSGLTSLEVLQLESNDLNLLPAGVFSGLTALQELYLYANQLSSLPDGAFSGLTALAHLALDGNAVDPLPVAVSLEPAGPGRFKAVAPTAAPFALTLPVSVVNGEIDGGATTLTIPAGMVSSDAVSVTRSAGSASAVTADIGALPGLPSNHLGYALEKSSGLPLEVFAAESGPACDRTEQVRDAIVAQVSGVSTCGGVTDAHLAAIMSLEFNSAGITSLQEGDFSGLTALQVLALDANELSSLPAGVFSGLTSLERLDLQENQLSSLLAGVFSGLTALRELYLNDNQLSLLPASVFSGLTSLETLYLHYNDLSSLPAGVFSGLTSLETLYLHYNDLSSLPAGVFSGLTALQELDLDGNPVNPLPVAVSLEPEGPGGFKAVAPTAAPFALTLPVSVVNGEIDGETTLTIPAGMVSSASVSVTRSAGSTSAVTADIGTLPELPSNHFGYALEKSSGLPLEVIAAESGAPTPVCDRTEQVRDEIVSQAGVSTCGGVSDADLAAITFLGLNSVDITLLKEGDFSGLTALQELHLNGNEFSLLPAGVFSGLTSLERLDLDSNQLSLLPAGVFSGLTSLRELDLDSNQLSLLPAGVFSGLTSLRELDLNNNALSSLLAGVFSGLTSLQELYLYDNELSSLPAGVFSGLTALARLELDGNAVDPLPVAVSLEPAGPGGFKAVALTAAPFALTLPVSVVNGEIDGETTLTIPAGMVSSASVSVTRSAGSTSAVTADIGTLPELPSNHQGYALEKSSGLPLEVIAAESGAPTPVCDRTEQVRDEIVYQAEVSTCGGVSDTHLAAVTFLDLEFASITLLKEGDFSGLPSLQDLYLGDNELSLLPAGVFSGLPALTDLDLNNNALSSLDAGVFSDLTAVTSIDLSGNALSSLPAEVFSGLPALTDLDLNNNALSSLDAGVFSDLTAVTSIDLSGNALSSFPAGVFSGLKSLSTLDLSGNDPDPLLLTVTVEKVGTDQARAKVLAGAPFAVAIPVTVVAGTLDGDAMALGVAAGSVDGTPVTVTRTAGTRAAVTVDVDLTSPPTLPANHTGYAFVKSTSGLPVEILPEADNAAPSFTSSETFEAAENQTTVGTVEASDDDAGDDITGYEISGGEDRALFAIDEMSGALTFQTAPNYEDPQDANTDNAYLVVVQATGGTGDGEQTTPQTITVTVMNADEGQSGTVSIDDATPMVGDELTASTAGEADPDGLADPFAPTWQWYRTPSGGSETEIAGATSATYTVVEADLDAALTAKASWTDVGGFANTLASTPTAAVTALPTVTVAAATGGETVTEGTDAAFTLSRTGSTAAALTVTVTVSETGSVLKDASAVPSSVTFDVGSDEATLALATNDDDTDDDNGTVTVTLGTGTGYTVGDPGAAMVAVSDNDVPVDFVLAVPATVAEDAGTVTVTVTATPAENAPPATLVEVQLARVSGTATGGSDYDAVSETVRFQVSDFAPATVDGQPRYQAEWTHAVVIHDDEVVEDDETVVLEMSPTSAFLLIHTLHGGIDAVRKTLTIVDNDAANVAPSFTSSETFGVEENGTAVGTVEAEDDDAGDDITGYEISGGADAGFFSIGPTTGVLTFDDAPNFEDAQDQGAGNTYEVTVQATSGTGDREQTAPQTITVTVTNADEGQSGTVSIDDTAPMVGDELTASTAGVADPDGLPNPFAPTYQWYRTPSGGSETEIAGATSATYTVVEADLDAALTAKASWTDVGGFANTLASTPTAAVTALPTVTIAAAAGGETVTEGTDAAFTLSRTGATAAALTVTVTVSQTGSVLKDASAVPSSVTFAAGAATATLALATNDDDTDDDNGTVTVTLGTGTGYTVGDPGAAMVAVSDNDVPVDFVLAVPATVAEDAGTVTVTVTVTTAENAPPARGASVQLRRVGGTATGGDDYEAVSETVRFQVSAFAAATVDGQPRYRAVWTHDVTIHDDEEVEDDETLVLEMSPSPGFLSIHTLGGVGLDAVRATLTIVDNDLPVVTIAADMGTVVEEEGAAGFTLSRTGPTAAVLTVTVAVTQEVDRDLLPDGAEAERTVTFAVGSATAALSVTLEDDDLAEAIGELTVEVQAGMGYTVSDPGSATVDVTDGDTGRPQPANLMAGAGAGVGEVVLSWDAHAPYLVFVRHQYRYKTGGDYAEWTDIPNSGQIAVGAGDGSSLTGYAVTGLVGGQLHTFEVRTYGSSSSASDPSDEATATPRSAVVSFGAESYSVDEGGTVAVTVQLDAAPGREVVVPVAAAGAGGATPPGETGADWSGVPENVTFGATDTEQTFTLAATDDTDVETGESVTLSFGTLPAGVTAGTPSEATVTIVDADVSLPTLSVANAAAAESDGVTFTVTLSEAATDDVTATWTASIESGDTAEAEDLGSTTGTVTVMESQTTAMITVPTAGDPEDTTDEDDETFTVTLSGVSSNVTLAADPTATGTINDDDDPPSVSVGDATAAEGAPMEFPVTLSAASGKTVTVGWATSVETGDNATADTDFTAASGTLTFMPDETTATVAVATEDDTLYEPDEETFTLTLSSPTNARIEKNAATGTIVDNDAANAAPSFTSSETFTPAENQTAVGTVAASDSDTGDEVTGYALSGGADQALFAIDETNGALTFLTAPDYENPQDANTDNAYVVVVRATSGKDARVMTADQTITVTVMDDDTEAPAAPDAPSVSPASVTSLNVSWSAPDNAGPEITDYDVQYRAGTSGPWSDGSHIGTALTAMITGLLEDTEYDVQVRATNDEGTGGWSASGRGRTDANAAPSFTSSETFTPAENQTAVGTVAASDSDTGDDITGYALSGGADQALFAIDKTNGMLTFQAVPDYEAPQDANTDNAYLVVVQATSGTGDREQTGTQTITVTVMDDDTEAPGAPGAPSVSPASATSLNVTWSAPDNAGPAITDYDYRHRTTSPQGAWVEVTNTTSTARSATIGSLQEDTSYDVQVRATNDEGTGGWSVSGSGATDANAAPSFTSAATFTPAENQTAVGTVEASDSDEGDEVTGYVLSGGADQALFSINNSGALMFQTAPNYEDSQDANNDNAYVVVVQATSGTGDRVKTAPQAITVTVMDEDEQPATPAKPTLAAVSGSSTSLTATWTEPGRNGGPAITGYNVEYRVSTATTWNDFTHTGTTTTTTLTGLTASTSYQVRVQALNGETPSAWSDPSEAVSTEADAANNPPVFSGSMTTRTVPENTGADTNVGAPVTAMDDDRGDMLTYSLDGTNAASFDIDEDSGQIRTISGVTYNHEEKSSYAVIVTVTDGTDRATIGVLIDIADVDEQPDQPAKPTLAVVSGSSTSLVASWTKPGRNGGPDITGYNVEYRVSTVTAWETFTHRGAGVTRTLTGLTASTSYQVRVQALNGETPSAFSDPSEAVSTEADATTPEDADTPTPEDVDTPTPEEDADRLLQVTCAIARKNGVTDSEGFQCEEYLDGDGARTLEQLIALQTQIIDRLPPGQYDYYDLAGRQTLYKAEDGRSTTTKGGSSEPDSSEPDSSEPDAPPPVSPLTAHFADAPSGHDGARAFTLRVAFSEAIAIGYEAFRDHSVGVSGGEVTKARRVDKRRDLWEITVKPASDAAVSVSLSPPPACDETGAICTGDGRPLSAGITAIVPGPAQEAEEPEEDQPEEDQPEEEQQPQEPPPAPQNLTGVANSDGSITLSWDAPDDDTITGYQILRRRPYFGEDELLTYVADTGSAATSYTDTEATPKVRHVYRVKAINPAGVGHRSNSISVTAAAAKVVATSSGLAPNFPNPFNSRTLIPYRLATPGAVRLEIYNLLGQSLRTLVDQYQDAGFYKVRWDARDRRGALVSAGMYLVRLHYPGGVQTQRLLYLK